MEFLEYSRIARLDEVAVAATFAISAAPPKIHIRRYIASQDIVYPKAHSVMFYKLFLDGDVTRFFEGYAALAVLEWDIVVAHPTSFERLYEAAFVASEIFWVKGSTLTETEFHEAAGVSATWHVPGHLNGNAICESSWPCFVPPVHALCRLMIRRRGGPLRNRDNMS